MKLLHTSDWHLGHTLYGKDREEEQGAMIDQIEAILKEETPDVLVISGDIYHTSQPSAAIQTFFTKSIMRLKSSVPGMEIVIIAGNHDSASKHEISKDLWETQGVHTIGTVDKTKQDDLIIRIGDKGWILAVPYQSERSISAGFYQSLLDRVEELNKDGKPVVMAAHLTVQNSDFTGHEDVRDLIVGGIEGIDLADLGKGYDYVALGHIHRPQTVDGPSGRVRYSGTPIAISYDEAYSHSVSIVEIAGHGCKPVIREVEIINPRPLVTLPTQGFADWKSVQALLDNFPKDARVYLRLNVEVDDYLPQGAEREAREKLNGTDIILTHINSRRKKAGSGVSTGVTVSQFQNMDPMEVARLYSESIGITFDKELENLFQTVVQTVNSIQRI